MKTYNLLIISLLALGLAGTGCGNKGNHVEVLTESMPTTPTMLKLNWPVDRHGIQTMDMQMNSEMSMPWAAGQKMSQNMKMGQEASLTVLKNADPSKRTLELKYLATTMNMAMNDKPGLNFDSATSKPGDTNPAAATLGKMVGASVRFILDANGQVESVEGADELAQRITSSPGADPTGMMKNMFNADTLKQQVDFAHNLPDKAVQPGDSWPVQHEYPMGSMGTMIMNFTNTLEGWEKHHGRYCAKIAIEGTMASKPGDSPSLNGMKMTVHDGKCSGETLFDLDLGMFVEGTLDQNMEMEITIPNPMGRKNPSAPKTVTLQSDVHQIINTKFELK